MQTKQPVALSGHHKNNSERPVRFKNRNIKTPNRKPSHTHTNPSELSSQSSLNYNPEENNKLLLTKSSKMKCNNGRNALTASDLPFEKQTIAKLECHCTICQAQNEIRIPPEEVPVHPFFRSYDFKSITRGTHYDKDFVFILKRLIPPTHASQSLRLPIPETVAFINGEAKFIVSNR